MRNLAKFILYLSSLIFNNIENSIIFNAIAKQEEEEELLKKKGTSQ